MAGSKDIFLYTDDTGASRLVRLDESNMRALGYTPATVATAAAANANSTLTKLTGNERYINCTAETSEKRPVARKLIVPRNDNEFFLDGGTIELPVLVDADNGTVELLEFFVTNAVGEPRQFAQLGRDTGLDDQ